jgi:hypothetical protein
MHRLVQSMTCKFNKFSHQDRVFLSSLLLLWVSWSELLDGFPLPTYTKLVFDILSTHTCNALLWLSFVFSVGLLGAIRKWHKWG